jgi:CheY-like chemotaxis protein
MNKLKVALLEDEKEQLKYRRQILIESGLVEVVAWATNSQEFREKVNESNANALLLDIDLGGDKMTGLEMAYELKLPVLFVSGHNAKNLKEIETLKRDFDLPVHHITKPFSDKDFIKSVGQFKSEIDTIINTKFIQLDISGSRREKIAIDTIVCLCTDKANGAESNNKQIFFSDRKPEILVDFSFSKMEDKGFSKNQFLTIHKSFRVNAGKILCYKKDTHEVEVEVFKSPGKTEKKHLPVSENFRNDIKYLKG